MTLVKEIPDSHKECVVVGSGPSLEDFDFNTLNDPDIWVMAINREIKRTEYTQGGWVYTDPEVGQAVIDDGYAVPPTTMVFEPRDKPMPPDRPWIDQVTLLDMNYCDYKGFYGEFPEWKLDDDLIYIHATTATTALVLAYKLGFRRIRMLGIDCAYHKDGHFYYDKRRYLLGSVVDCDRMRVSVTKVVNELRLAGATVDWPLN